MILLSIAYIKILVIPKIIDDGTKFPNSKKKFNAKAIKDENKTRWANLLLLRGFGIT